MCVHNYLLNRIKKFQLIKEHFQFLTKKAATADGKVRTQTKSRIQKHQKWIGQKWNKTEAFFSSRSTLNVSQFIKHIVFRFVSLSLSSFCGEAFGVAAIQIKDFSFFSSFQITFGSAEKPMTVGRSLSVGGPDQLLPDTPRNIVNSKNYNQSIPLIIGATKHDGSYYAGGWNFISIFEANSVAHLKCLFLPSSVRLFSG